ncbi:unnamed protein product, partial [Scytosiphon promiscuus]
FGFVCARCGGHERRTSGLLRCLNQFAASVVVVPGHAFRVCHLSSKPVVGVWTLCNLLVGTSSVALCIILVAVGSRFSRALRPRAAFITLFHHFYDTSFVCVCVYVFCARVSTS